MAQHIIVAADAFGDVDDITQQDGHVLAALRPRRAVCGGRQLVRSVTVGGRGKVCEAVTAGPGASPPIQPAK